LAPETGNWRRTTPATVYRYQRFLKIAPRSSTTCQGWGRGFESLRPLLISSTKSTA